MRGNGLSENGELRESYYIQKGEEKWKVNGGKYGFKGDLSALMVLLYSMFVC